MIIIYTNIFDSHAHYDARQFNDDRYLLLDSLPTHGVRGVVTIGDTIKSSKRAQTLAERYPYMFFAAGIHPHSAKEADDSLEDELRAIAKHPKLKAIGEIGLDYHYDYSPRETQKEVFIRQLKLAEELALPVIIHDREAHGDTLEIIKEYKPKGIVHSYSGSVELARELVSLGMYLGFTGVVTFKNVRVPLEVVAEVPLERLLVETDCPYLAPVPYRGKRSDSTMIPATIEKMAEIKGITPQKLMDITFSNACRVYNIEESFL